MTDTSVIEFDVCAPVFDTTVVGLLPEMIGPIDAVVEAFEPLFDSTAVDPLLAMLGTTDGCDPEDCPTSEEAVGVTLLSGG